MQQTINKQINLVKTMVKNPKEFVTKLLYGNTDLPFSFREMLKKIGNETVSSLTIVRSPISNAVFSVMNAFQGFQLRQKLKESPYDSLFHLKLRINNKYDLEKESVPKLDKAKNKEGQETFPVRDIPNCTINQFVENVIKRMGMKAFLHYNGSNNNCQVFVMNLLNANGLNNSEYDQFIKQDTSFVFEHNSFFRKFMNMTTDVGRSMNQLEEGTGLKKKKRSKLSTMSNNQIISICIKLEIPLVKVCMKDELNNNMLDGNYIMNLQNHNQDGSHWISFIKRAGKVYYNDSFGCVPPQNEFDIFRNENDQVYYNTQIHQDMNSTACGYWAIYFLYYMNTHKGAYLSNFKSFNKLFGKDTNQNEKNLLTYVNKII
jgi:hypothetical protein